MVLEFDIRDDICVLSLKGRFVSGSDSEYELASEELRRANVRNAILNCAELPYIDSTGLSFVVALHKTLHDRGGKVVLSFVNARVRKLLALTRLVEVIPVFDDVDSAFEAIKLPLQRFRQATFRGQRENGAGSA